MSQREYRCAAQERLIDVIVILSGNEVTGLTIKEVADAARTSQPNAFRDVKVLQAKGMAEQIPDTDRWRLGPKLVQMGLAHMRHMDKAQSRLDEVKNRYTREPR